MDPSDLVVSLSLIPAAWMLYLLGFRPVHGVGPVLALGLFAAVWWVCSTLLVDGLVDAGLPTVLAAAPPTAVYIGLIVLVYRETPWLARRQRSVHEFGRALRDADEAMWRAFREAPPLCADGKLPVTPYRARLDRTLAGLRRLRPPDGQWSGLLDERILQHEGWISVIASPVPIGPEVTDPLGSRSRQWMETVNGLLAGNRPPGAQPPT